LKTAEEERVPQEVPPVLLHVKNGNKQSYCIAKLTRDKRGTLAAEPFVKPQDPVFASLGVVILNGRFLELLRDSGGGKPLYIYKGIISIDA
jgi:hypothetical protein